MCYGAFLPTFSYVRRTRPHPYPVTALYMPTNSFGAISEKLQRTVDRYISSKLKHNVCTILYPNNVLILFKLSVYDLNVAP